MDVSVMAPPYSRNPMRKYAVRCIFAHEENVYEERVTLFFVAQTVLLGAVGAHVA